MTSVLGNGDGINAAFQLVKRYGDYVRPITKAQGGSVRAAVNGVEKMEALDFVVELANGNTHFPAGKNTSIGAGVTAGFGFDVPARFDTDRLTISIKSFKAGEIPVHTDRRGEGMTAIPQALESHLAGEVTTHCFCWIIRRNDGMIQGFTDHDRTLLVGRHRLRAANRPQRQRSNQARWGLR